MDPRDAVNPPSAPPATGATPSDSETTARQAIDIGLIAVICAYIITALVGLPLFQDGAWYFFKIATLGVAEPPNLRYTALLPQLPTIWTAPLLDDAVMLRHLFSLSYVALPLASLLACWLLVRRRAPALMLFPLLWFLLNLVNFSGVSELLSSLYLTWPLVLAMLLAPERTWTWVYAGVTAPMLTALHPLAFLPAFALALLAAAIAWLRPRLRRPWGPLAGLLLVTGSFRLMWTAMGANSYERGRLQTDSAINYLMTETPAQHLLLAAVSLLGVLLAAGMLANGKVRDGCLRIAGAIAWLLPAVVVLIALEILNGEGIKLKAGLSFVVGLVLMGLGSAVVLAPWLPRGPGITATETLHNGRIRIAALIVTCMVTLLLAKSAAWWTATRGLQNLLGEADTDCITLSATEPFGLQWPWMAIIDDWATPMNALAFRPYLVLQPERGIEPVPLLLRHDRCDIARKTGKVYPTSWIERDIEVVNARFGPLR
ncbi:hypothetical protein [Halochromatium glycolicum]|uniref:Uncharacterized protein n=1 Tax=Halochromatium glycolicum TaxID=85075 RepID=A0AAJ0U7D2_9GAMM|nr:hypothetical protein [Halochromatium glycolicum]MBK1705852.1 hypothetical protein [Halochromatium glycolicum]